MLWESIIQIAPCCPSKPPLPVSCHIRVVVIVGLWLFSSPVSFMRKFSLTFALKKRFPWQPTPPLWKWHTNCPRVQSDTPPSVMAITACVRRLGVFLVNWHQGSSWMWDNLNTSLTPHLMPVQGKHFDNVLILKPKQHAYATDEWQRPLGLETNWWAGATSCPGATSWTSGSLADWKNTAPSPAFILPPCSLLDLSFPVPHRAAPGSPLLRHNR